MWQIRRIKLDGVGTRSARFRAVEFDLTGERTNVPLHSLLWLRNGGGKSSLLALIGAVMRPAKGEFLSAAANSRDVGRVLGDYVLDGDTAHVVIEWGDGDRRLVTGALFEWKDRHQPLDTNRDHERLDQWRYLFEPVPGQVEMDRLPFTTGDKRTPAAHFVSALRSYSALTDVPIVTGQAEWARTLDAHGIDSDLWRTILDMNRVEGGIEYLFLYNNANAFVRDLLGYIVDPSEIDPVAALLHDVAAELATRPDTEADLRFSDEAIGHLDRLGRAYADDRAAQDLWTEIDAGARRLRVALRERAELATEEARLAEETRAAASAAAAKAEADADSARFIANEYARRAAVFREETAESHFVVSERRASEAASLVDAWIVAPHVAQLVRAEAREAALTHRLAELTLGAAGVRDARLAAAAQLAGGLEALAAASRRARDRAGVREARVRDVERRSRDAEVKAAATLREIDAARTRLAGLVEAHERDVAAARTAGLLDEGEAPAGARERAAAVARGASQRAAEVLPDIATTREDLATGRRALPAVVREATLAASALDAVSAVKTELEARIAELAAEGRLAELLGVDELDLVGTATLTLERLAAAQAASQAEVDASGVDVATEGRAIDHLRAHRRLPPARDLDRAGVVLAEAGISAVLGWTYLADVVAPERRLATFLIAPLLASGVLVNDEADLGRASEVLAEAGLGPSTLVALGTTAQLERASGGAREPAAPFVVPPSAGMYDPSRAEIELEAREREQVERQARIEGLAHLRDSDRSLADRVAALAAVCPPERLDELEAELTAAAGRASRARAAEQAANELVASLETHLGRLSSEREEQLALAGGANTLVARLDELVRRGSDADAARVEQASLPARASAAEDARAIAHERAERAGRTAARAARRAHEMDLAADALTTRRAQLPGDVVATAPPRGTSLEGLDATYRAAEEAYRLATSDSDVAHELETAHGERLAATKPLEGSDPDTIARARELLSSPDGRDDAARARSLRTAQERARELSVEHGRAEGELRAARDEVAEASSADRERIRNVEVEPTDRADAHRLEALYRGQWQGHVTRARAETTGRDEARLVRDAALALAKTLRDQATLVDLPEDPELIVEPPFSGDELQATERVAETLRALRDARATAAETRDVLGATTTDILVWAGRPEYARVAAEVRSRFTSPDIASELAPETERFRTEFTVRRDQLQAQLERIEDSRANVVTRAMGLVKITLRDLERFSRLSTVPAGLGDWSDQRFITIDKRGNPDMSGPVMRDRIGRAVDTLIASSREINGQNLLWRSLEAVVGGGGEGGFRATVLKPNTSFLLERTSVELMGKWSGGERVTVAILLYATIAKLRALNRGRVTSGGAGSLLLDNPLGKVTYVPFLEAQQVIADAAGIQLVFMSAVSDLRAIDRFPNIIRVRNAPTGERDYIRVEGQVRDESGVVSLARGQRLGETAPLFS